MDALLTSLGAAADPTRLRLLALAARGAFCVNDFCEILGQSQPRLSRHLKLLCEAGFLARSREGASVWFALAQGPIGALARDILRHLPAEDPMLASDRRGAARVLAERARAASEKFRLQGADWDEMRALNLPADAVEHRLLDLLDAGARNGRLGRVLDIGTGTGRLLEVLAPRIASGLGVDASRAMLALARVRLASPDYAHIGVRLADMYALPLADESFDTVLLQMVLHYAEEPEAVVAEAARVLAPGGRLVVVDLAPHGDTAMATRMGHRRRGFSDADMLEMLCAVRLAPAAPVAVPAPGESAPRVRIWQGTAPSYLLPVPDQPADYQHADYEDVT
jgi:ArsR family transcriptional regulator